MSDNLNEFGQKQAFSFDEVTGEFKSIVWADPDQLNEGEFLLPANATFNGLDAEVKGVVSVYVDNAWQSLADNRGLQYWDSQGEKHLILEIGETVPEDALFEAPLILPTHEEQIVSANLECTKRINSKWNPVGQINVLLGVYSDEDKADCLEWIEAHRGALSLLISRDDLISIDVTDDQFWP